MPHQRQGRSETPVLRSSDFRPWLILLGLWLALSAAPLRAETLELNGPAGLTLNAEFAAGKPDLPPVLILHGFLQTHHFPTIRQLADSLAELGYPVLTPTLSLGIDRRNASLACEAVHVHSMEKDAEEIGYWVEWLRKRYQREPILIGHSAGSLTLLAYLSGRPSPPVQRAILVTMAHFGTRNEFSYETPEDGARAASALAAGATDPQPYALAYCRSYVATPADYLSYFGWNRQRVSETLNRIEVPLAVILGDEDARMDSEWLDDLKSSGIELHIIPGASHFFDRQYEFELLDEVDRLLKAASG
jgi:pimeloyl-ACP methyl ester carboxylesterase